MVLINPKPDEGSVWDVEKAEHFHSAVQQAEALQRGKQRVEVWIQARQRDNHRWTDVVRCWTGTYDQDPKMPTREAIIATALKAGFRPPDAVARAVTRTTI